MTKAQEEARAIAMLLKVEASNNSSGDPTESRDTYNADLPSRSEGQDDTLGTRDDADAYHLINLELPRLPLETTYEAAEAVSASLIQGYTEQPSRVQTQRNDMITASNAA